MDNHRRYTDGNESMDNHRQNTDGNESGNSEKVPRRAYLKYGVGSLLVGVAGCLGEGEEGRMEMAAGAEGTGTHEAATSISRGLDEHSDDLSLALQTSDGWTGNTYLYDNDEIPAGAFDNNTLQKARDQDDPFDEEPVSKLPAQGFYYQSQHAYMIATEESGIESTADIDSDNTVYPVEPGFGANLLAAEIFERASLDERVGDYITVDTTDIAGAAEEGRVDALVAYGDNFDSLTGYCQELDARVDGLRFIETGEDIVQGIEDTSGARMVEDFEPYGWDSDMTAVTDTVTGWSLDAQWCFGPEWDSDSVYELCRVVYEHSDTIAEGWSNWLDMSEGDTMTTAVIDDLPVHEGAAEFYQDHDLWNDEWEIDNEYSI